MNFFDEVKRLSKEQNTTVEATVKKALGENQGAVDQYYGWMKRDIYPRMDDGFKIAEALGVTMNHFFTDKEAPSRYSEINDILSSFSDVELANIKVMLETMKNNKK